MAGRPRIMNQNPTLEFRSLKDECWYVVNNLVFNKEKKILSIRFLNLSKSFDENFGYVDSEKELSEFINRFRHVSTPLQEHECKNLKVGLTVCAFLDQNGVCKRFCDGSIQLVHHKAHTRKGGEASCSCVFHVRWMAGPKDGSTERMHLEHILRIQDCEVGDTILADFWSKSRDYIKSGRTESKSSKSVGRPLKLKRTVGVASASKEEFAEFQRDIGESSHLRHLIQPTAAATGLQEYDPALLHLFYKYFSDLTHVKLEIDEYAGRMESMSDQIALLDNEKASVKAAKEDAVKQKDTLFAEAEALKKELEKVRGDRDFQLAEVHRLIDEVSKYKGSTGNSMESLEKLSVFSKTLEEICSSQSKEIKMLQQQLDAANQKLQVSDLEYTRKMIELEAQKSLADDLEERLADAEIRVMEGKKLEEQLQHEIIQTAIRQSRIMQVGDG